MDRPDVEKRLGLVHWDVADGAQLARRQVRQDARLADCQTKHVDQTPSKKSNEQDKHKKKRKNNDLHE